jgi:hypothetical protein
MARKVVLLIVVLASACISEPDLPTPRPLPTPVPAILRQTPDIDGLIEHIVRYWLREMAQAPPGSAETLCLSSLRGYPIDLQAGTAGITWTEPPPKFLKRFPGPVRVVGTSECQKASLQSSWHLVLEAAFPWERWYVVDGQVTTSDAPLHAHLSFRAWGSLRNESWRLDGVRR